MVVGSAARPWDARSALVRVWVRHQDGGDRLGYLVVRGLTGLPTASPRSSASQVGVVTSTRRVELSLLEELARRIRVLVSALLLCEGTHAEARALPIPRRIAASAHATEAALAMCLPLTLSCANDCVAACLPARPSAGAVRSTPTVRDEPPALRHAPRWEVAGAAADGRQLFRACSGCEEDDDLPR